jgi:hypothetical protein
LGVHSGRTRGFAAVRCIRIRAWRHTAVTVVAAALAAVLAGAAAPASAEACPTASEADDALPRSRQATRPDETRPTVEACRSRRRDDALQEKRQAFGHTASSRVATRPGAHVNSPGSGAAAYAQPPRTHATVARGPRSPGRPHRPAPLTSMSWSGSSRMCATAGPTPVQPQGTLPQTLVRPERVMDSLDVLRRRVVAVA